jgi:hypothetical protein
MPSGRLKVILPRFIYENIAIECSLFAAKSMAMGNSLSPVVSNTSTLGRRLTTGRTYHHKKKKNQSIN